MTVTTSSATPTRRDAVRVLGGAAAIATQARPILGANDRINIAVIGVGGRGTDHLNEYSKLECHVAAVCDVNQAAQERAVALIRRTKGHDPKVYSDMRKVYADKEVDAVSIATPNHWHTLAAIWAMQAGKDVYVEKPVCHNIFEGKQLVAAARKYNRIAQAGTQSRSIAHQIEAMKMLKDGAIGKIYMAKGLCYKRRPSIGRKPDQVPTPAGIDWSQFLGPAPLRPFNELRFKYNWHWFWDTGNGDIGNQGVHEMDIMLWGAGVTTLPKNVVCTGGKLLYDDDQETPNVQMATFHHDGLQLVFEVRGMVTPSEGPLPVRGKNVVGNVFYGSDGYLAIDGGGWWLYKDANKPEAEGKAQRGDTAPHMNNFLAAIRSRKKEDLHAEVAVNALASDYCHLANISYRVGRLLRWDAAKEKFNDSEADAMISRKYRAPYIVPEKV